MCGIVGAVAERGVAPILLEGLRRLEYRGYDSAGMVVLNDKAELARVRTTGKVNELAAAMERNPLPGVVGIAHTRWATHGKPSEANAHPHICNNEVAVVHNGIIENHDALRKQQKEQGYRFTSETDTEVVAHQVHFHLSQGKDLLKAVQDAQQLSLAEKGLNTWLRHDAVVHWLLALAWAKILSPLTSLRCCR